MTAERLTSNTSHQHWRRVRGEYALDTFAAIGWTAQQWDDTYQALFPASPKPGSKALANWLRNPPKELVNHLGVPITPAMVLQLLDRYGTQTPRVLTGLTAGASERFAATYLNPKWRHHSRATTTGWAYAQSIGLTEPHATGWAPTGYLNARGKTPGGPTKLIRTWTTQFGPDAYLYVLAGFDLDEAVAMRDAKTLPTEDQVRVMVALNGHTLPDGV